jgi:hypothetical protein
LRWHSFEESLVVNCGSSAGLEVVVVVAVVALML